MKYQKGDRVLLQSQIAEVYDDGLEVWYDIQCVRKDDIIEKVEPKIEPGDIVEDTVKHWFGVASICYARHTQVVYKSGGLTDTPTANLRLVMKADGTVIEKE